MKCGFCSYANSVCYTSNPPQVKCPLTGKFKFIGSDCDAFAEGTVSIEPVGFATPCLVCGEDVPCDIYCATGKICDKCKEAIMHVRKELNKNIEG